MACGGGDNPPCCIPWPLLVGWAVGSAPEATMTMQWSARLAGTVTMVVRSGGYVRTMSEWLHTCAARWGGTTTATPLVVRHGRISWVLPGLARAVAWGGMLQAKVFATNLADGDCSGSFPIGGIIFKLHPPMYGDGSYVG